MARSSGANQVNARILYWGVAGAGKSTNLEVAFAKLRPDHRGELERVPTGIDPTVRYEILPITLGEVAGIATRIELVAPPGAPEQAPTRKQLLDQVDGVVLVIDSQPARADENLAAFTELRNALAAYGRGVDSLPLVVQYNKRDLGDPYALEDLHRKLSLPSAPVFEAVASQGVGVLQALSSIAKQVVRLLRSQAATAAPPAAPEAPVPAAPPAAPEAPVPAAPPDGDAGDHEPEMPAVAPVVDPVEPIPAAAPMAGPAARMEAAILAEAEHPDAEEISAAVRTAEEQLATPGDGREDEIAPGAGVRLTADLSIVSVGQATRAGERTVSLPIVLGDATGQTSTLVLTLRLDPLVDEAD